MKNKLLPYFVLAIYLIGFYYPITQFAEIYQVDEQIEPDRQSFRMVKVSHPINDPDSPSFDLELSSLYGSQKQYGIFDIPIFDITAKIGAQLPFRSVTSDPFVDYGIIEAINVSYVVYVVHAGEIISTIDGYLFFDSSTQSLSQIKNETLLLDSFDPGLSITNSKNMNIFFSVLRTYIYDNRTVYNPVGHTVITWNQGIPSYYNPVEDIYFEMIVIWPNPVAIVLFVLFYILVGATIFYLFKNYTKKKQI